MSQLANVLSNDEVSIIQLALSNEIRVMSKSREIFNVNQRQLNPVQAEKNVRFIDDQLEKYNSLLSKI